MKRHSFLFVLLSALLPAAPAAAQAEPDSVVADTIPQPSNVPRKAFIKSMILPGWGQFSIGSEVRGSIWVAVRGASYYMLARTLDRLGDAKDRAGAARTTAREVARLAALDSMAVDTAYARELSDPVRFDEVVQTAVQRDANVRAAQSLVESRKRHRQDWITYTVFFTMLDAVDAYVAAHLRNFPAEVTTRPGLDGGVSLEVSVPVGGRGGR